jgi:hypothetical protein
MREDSISRLEVLNIDITNSNYLVYYFYHKRLKKAIEQYGNGIVLDIGCGNKPYESLFDGLNN